MRMVVHFPMLGGDVRRIGWCDGYVRIGQKLIGNSKEVRIKSSGNGGKERVD